MPMDSVNEENVERLKHLFETTQHNLELLKSTTSVETYYKELCELEEIL